MQNNILLIITILLFIFFAIIGYVVDKKRNKENKEKEVLTEVDERNFEPIIDIPKEEPKEFK